MKAKKDLLFDLVLIERCIDQYYKDNIKSQSSDVEDLKNWIEGYESVKETLVDLKVVVKGMK